MLGIERLALIGHVHEGDLGITGREAFAPPPGDVAHHLYLAAADGPALERMLRFRDALRTDPALARAYSDLKRDLAARFRDDRTSYTNAKTEFVERVLNC